MTDTSKESIQAWARSVRYSEAGDNWPMVPGLADFIEALATERDAATERARIFGNNLDSINAKLEETTERAEKAEAERDFARNALLGANALCMEHAEALDAEQETCDTLRARVAALEGVLGDAATSLETIARDGARKGTMLEDRSQVCGYATNRARVARAALSSAPAPSQAAAEVIIDGEKTNAFERLQAIMDWRTVALANRAEYDKHGVRNLCGPVFDAAEALLAEIERLDRAAEQDGPDRCFVCGKPFVDGDLYYPDASGGELHAECCGPDRESYTKNDGEPLGPNDQIPEPLVWRDECLDRQSGEV